MFFSIIKLNRNIFYISFLLRELFVIDCLWHKAISKTSL